MSYIFWIDSLAVTHKKHIAQPRSFEFALDEYIKWLPVAIDPALIKFQKVSNDEVFK